MTVRVSVAVMAHKKRATFVPQLVEALDRPAEVIWDKRNDRWDTGSRAMLAYDSDATHHLVVQDDAIIPRDLVAGVERALQLRPAEGLESPLSLYLGNSAAYRHVLRRLDDGVSWVTISTLSGGVGIVMPTAVIEECIKWGHSRRDIANYDTRISRWLGRQGIETWYTWPSFVSHRESPSLVRGRGSKGRRAQRFLGVEASALEADMSGRAVRVEPWGRARVTVRPYSGRSRGRIRRAALSQRDGSSSPKPTSRRVARRSRLR